MTKENARTFLPCLMDKAKKPRVDRGPIKNTSESPKNKGKQSKITETSPNLDCYPLKDNPFPAPTDKNQKLDYLLSRETLTLKVYRIPSFTQSTEVTSHNLPNSRMTFAPTKSPPTL